MNNNCIIAWMDDLQMSAHLAKISTTHSYQFQFCDAIAQISDISEPAALIIDLNSISEENLQRLVELKQMHNIAVMGYCQELNGPLLNYFKEMGCEMVFNRYELMKNLGSILNQIFNGSRI